MKIVLYLHIGLARPVPALLFATMCVCALPLRAQSVGANAERTADSTFIVRAVNQIRARAATENPQVEIARAQRTHVDAQAKASGQIAPMTFSAGLSEAPIGALDQGNVRAEVGRDFRTADRRRAERAVVDAAVRLADIEVGIAARAASADVTRALITTAALRRIAARLHAEDSLLVDAEETVRARFGTGDARYVDVLRIRTERLHVQSERSDVTADERLARAGLGASGNQESRTTALALADTLATKPIEEFWRAILPELQPATSIDSLLSLSSTNRRTEIDELRAAAELQLTTAEQKSQLSGYAGLQRIGQANNGPTIGPSVGFTMSLPFTAKRGQTLASQASVAALTAARDIRRLNAASTRQLLAAAIEHYSAQRARLENFDAALLRGVRDERESALSSYRTGELSLTELLDFERAMSRAEIERLRALIDAVDALADLTRDADGAESPKHNARSAR